MGDNYSRISKEAEEMKTCNECIAFSKTRMKCKIGKVNPKTVVGVINAIREQGIGYVCSHNPLRDDAIKRMSCQS